MQRFCPNCGTPAAKADAFCANCGTRHSVASPPATAPLDPHPKPVNGPPATQQPPGPMNVASAAAGLSKTNSSRRSPIIVAALAVVLVASVSVALMLNRSDSGDRTAISQTSVSAGETGQGPTATTVVPAVTTAQVAPAAQSTTTQDHAGALVTTSSVAPVVRGPELAFVPLNAACDMNPPIFTNGSSTWDTTQAPWDCEGPFAVSVVPGTEETFAIARWTGAAWQARGVYLDQCEFFAAGMSEADASAAYNAVTPIRSPRPIDCPEPELVKLEPSCGPVQLVESDGIQMYEKSERVGSLQARLVLFGFLIDRYDEQRKLVDKEFGPASRAAVIDVQWLLGMQPTGVADETFFTVLGARYDECWVVAQ